MSWYNVFRGLTATKYYCTRKKKDDKASEGGEVGTVRKAWKCLLFQEVSSDKLGVLGIHPSSS